MSALRRAALEAPVIDWPAAKPAIPLWPTLWPSMLRPAATRALPFPFNDPTRRDFSLARYGLFQVARRLGLNEREVLFPDFFHSVELDAMLAAGARPRFFPVGRGLTVDPDDIRARIGPQTAAVYVIHYAGFPGPTEELAAVCRERGIALIEDCAHALLSSSGNRPLGSFGDAAAFSAHKSLPLPDGGVALLRGGWRDSDGPRQTMWRPWIAAHTVSIVLENLQMRGVPGADSVRSMGHRWGKAAFRAAHSEYIPMGTPNFDARQVNTGCSRLMGRLLLTQDLEAIKSRRRRNYEYLLDQLSDAVSPIFPALPAGVCPLFYPFQVRDRAGMLARLQSHGFTIGEFWPDRHPHLAGTVGDDADEIRRTALWLPCHQDLTIEMLDRLVAAVRCALVRRPE